MCFPQYATWNNPWCQTLRSLDISFPVRHGHTWQLSIYRSTALERWITFKNPHCSSIIWCSWQSLTNTLTSKFDNFLFSPSSGRNIISSLDVVCLGIALPQPSLWWCSTTELEIGFRSLVLLAFELTLPGICWQHTFKSALAHYFPLLAQA